MNHVLKLYMCVYSSNPFALAIVLAVGCLADKRAVQS